MTEFPADTPRATRHLRTRRAVLLVGFGVGLVVLCMFVSILTRRKALPTSALAGQTNLRTTFYGRGVDENGRGLAGVKFEFLIEAYPADWTFETRGREYERSSVSAVSDTNGNFEFDVNGAMLRLKAANIDGYRELYGLDGATRREDGGNSVFTRSIRLISWGQQQYRSDRDRPAVFVFVSDRAQVTTALPSQRGYRSYGPKRWIENRAAWPHWPSLDDVDWADAQPRRNVSVPLAFKVVDTGGRPMPGVGIAFEIERYRTLQEMRTDRYDSSKVRTKNERGLITTGGDGYARTTVNGFRLKSIDRVFLQGARWGEGPSPIVIGDFYVRDFVDQRGDLVFRCDDTTPIILVMAQPDEEESHALPSRGGYQRRGEDDIWDRVEPAWPEDVRRFMKYIRPVAATRPADLTPRQGR